MNAGDYAATLKFPMTAGQVRKYSQLQLAQFREAGITLVGVLGCNCPDDECDAYRAVKGQKIKIEDAPELPLPGCDKKFCKCILLAIA